MYLSALRGGEIRILARASFGLERWARSCHNTTQFFWLSVVCVPAQFFKKKMEGNSWTGPPNNRVHVSKKISCCHCLFCFVVGYYNYKHCVCPFLSHFLISLGHSSEVFPDCHLPYLSRCWIIHQFFVAWYCFSHYWVHHWASKVFKHCLEHGLVRSSTPLGCTLCPKTPLSALWVH